MSKNYHDIIVMSEYLTHNSTSRPPTQSASPAPHEKHKSLINTAIKAIHCSHHPNIVQPSRFNKYVFAFKINYHNKKYYIQQLGEIFYATSSRIGHGTPRNKKLPRTNQSSS